MYEHYERAGERERSERRECGVFRVALVAVIVLIFALCRYLVAHRRAALEFAQALRAAIEPLMSDVVEGGRCTAGQSSISAPMLLSHPNMSGTGGNHGWLESC